MPYKAIGHPNEDIKTRTLGRLASWWIQTFVVYGPGSVRGQPVRMGAESLVETARMYALDERGKRLYTSAFLSKPKGTDKSGRAGYLTCFEAVGPARFAGWAKGGERYSFLGRDYVYAPGEAMGRPVVEPLVRCLATEFNQAGHVYDVVLHNFQEGPLAALGAAAFDGYIETPDNGQILPSTASAASKDGGKETFLVADETHLFVTPALRSVYNTLTRNMNKRPDAEPWVLETTTMYAPGEQSVAEQTFEYARLVMEGRARKPNLLFMHRWGDVSETDIYDEIKLRAGLEEAAGEAAAWLAADGGIDRTMSYIWDPRNSVQESLRYHLNMLGGSATAWVPPQVVDRACVTERLQPGDEIALGFDGSLSEDSTVLVACRLSDGLVQLLHAQERPVALRRDQPWSVDRDLVDQAVTQAFEDFEVRAFFADPPYWQAHVRSWEKEFGEGLAPASYQHIIGWLTNRVTPMVAAVEDTHTALLSGDIKVADDPILVRHLYNACRWQRPQGDLIGKEFRSSPKTMDAAVGMVLAYQAAVKARVYSPPGKKKKDPNKGLVALHPLPGISA